MPNPGDKLGPYEIESLLGAGGMGQVYKARDTRLDRTVAIKIVAPQLVSNPEAKARFEREARAISQLQHPHICVLHDVGNEGGIDYLVMEYLDGDVLSDRLRRGPLPLPEARKIAIEIVDALEKAHRASILHRDLKPGNIMLTKAGPKLLDFGLAKPVAAAAAAAAPLSGSVFSPAAAATLTSPASPVTAAGSIVGTVQYMSPEQLEGKEGDARSDIFAFGLVLYEMLAGRRAFEGKTQASVVASILALDPPSITSLKPEIPTALDRMVSICLAKDPEERFQSAHDLKLQLEFLDVAAAAAPALAPSATPGRLSRLLPWAAAAVLAILAATYAFFYTREAAKPLTPARTLIASPEGATFWQRSAALSPDGRKWAFVAYNKDNKRLLWIRPLDSLTAQPLNGTDDADFPFWSPDSHYIAFFDGAKLKRIEASGGPAQTICDVAPVGRGGSWNQDGTIVFALGAPGPLMRVNANGGVPAAVTKLDPKRNETSHRWPWFLPDGKHFLFQVQTTATENSRNISVGSLDSSEHRELLVSDYPAQYGAGYILYLRETALIAQSFDTRKLSVSGEGTPLAESVGTSGAVAGARFSLSTNGTLAYFQGGGANGWQPFFTDSSGKPIGDRFPAGIYGQPAVSLDGRRLATSLILVSSGKKDVWIFDLTRGRTTTRLTFDGTSGNPVWSPDGNTIYYSSVRNGQMHIFSRRADGSGNEETVLLTPGVVEYPTSVSRDGNFLLYSHGAGGKNEVWALPLTGDRKPFAVVDNTFSNTPSEVSPDGKFLAYTSDSSGITEVYVTPFPSGGAKWQVTNGGAMAPHWRGDGKVLYFIAAYRGMSSVAVTETGGTIALSTPQELFQTHVVGPNTGPYSLAAQDGSRFFLNATDPAAGLEHVEAVLLTNWPAELKK